jgi:hypothetical protein
MYLACGTRPNISYAVNLLARFSQNPSEEHWYALNHLVGYIKKIPQRGVRFDPGQPSVKLFVNAGWGGEHERSTTGFILQHYGNPIAWGSKRQDVVAMSTCAAEYIALSIATKHLANLKIVLDEIDPVSEYEILCNKLRFSLQPITHPRKRLGTSSALSILSTILSAETRSICSGFPTLVS